MRQPPTSIERCLHILEDVTQQLEALHYRNAAKLNAEDNDELTEIEINLDTVKVILHHRKNLDDDQHRPPAR